jgi:hypothetical protein
MICVFDDYRSLDFDPFIVENVEEARLHIENGMGMPIEKWEVTIKDRYWSIYFWSDGYSYEVYCYG